MSNVQKELRTRFSEPRQELQHRLHQLLADREELDRRAKELRAEAREARLARTATALLPTEAPDTEGADEGEEQDPGPEPEALEAEADAILAERDQVKARIEEINEREQDFVREVTRDLVLGVEARTEELRTEGFAAVGRAVLDLVPEVLDRRQALADARGELNTVLARYNAQDGGDTRVQKKNLEVYLRRGREEASAPEIVGWLVMELVHWLRRGSSPIESWWEEHEVERLDGSVLYADPIPARDDTVFKLRRGRLPF